MTFSATNYWVWYYKILIFGKNYAKIVGAELVSALKSGQTRGLPYIGSPIKLQ